ncbi:DUF6069 family protein [Streptomyces sp. NBC_01264]|uniref:DUF6069 family protein n=1 Tax=Streptomyces sp. NBC_01264 TaxID=2903804 RepID=UPI00225593D1|nr:DUF6069 family protein [Streptomyces sp. NBC_01264]MCX4783774.1 DUF6069 family protein [Streptomyces sp. NBC_01264]
MTTNTRLAATSSASVGASTWRPRLLTVLGAAAGAAVVFLAGKAGGVALAVDQNDGKGPVGLGLGSFLGSAAGAALLGWALLALLEKFVPAGSRKIWTAVAFVVLLASLVLPFGVEATSGTKILLALTHLAVGLVVVFGLRRDAAPARG